MSHNETVQAEFTRQAETFRASPTLSAAEVTSRVGEALGPNVQRALDIACGPGILLPVLSARSRSVVGVDLTRKNLLLAREVASEKPVHLVRALVEHLPFAAGSFDAVVIRLALHHFLEPGLALAAARSLLRSRGRLVVLDVLGPEDRATSDLRNAVERLRDPSHTSLLSRASMTAHLEQAGFTVREETLWSQPRAFSDWAAVMNEPRRMADLELVLRALCRRGGDPAGLRLREEGSELCFTYDWGLFVADLEGDHMQFEVSALIPATPEEIFDAWLDSRGHSEMTGSPAKASPEPGAEFEAWDGYIRGSNVILERPTRIVQSWRTSNFDASEPDSQIEVLLEAESGGTRVTIHHTRLPADGSRYETGWPNHYFEPMRSYFSRIE